jgi:hypothetical protein
VSGEKPRVAVLKLITPFFGSQPYLIDKKGEAVEISIENRFAFPSIKTLFIALRLRFSIKQCERFETLHTARAEPPVCAQF